MRAVNVFAGFCLMLFVGLTAATGVFAQDEPKTETPAAGRSSAPPVVQNVNQTEERYRIGLQDTVEINVSGLQKYSLTTPIAPDGTIRMNNIAEPIRAVCKTEQELAKEIADRYRENILRNPFVTVRVTSQLSQFASVIGAVKKPGQIYLNRRVRLLELLSNAGGPDSERAGTKLIVARTGSTSACKSEIENTAKASGDDYVLYQYKIKDVLEGKENMLIQPGDIVSVMDADVVYVYGNVIEQGSVKLNRPLTLRQAIASAKGFKPASKKDKIKVLRLKDGTAEWDTIVFNLKDIDTGKVQDPFLLPNDIVAVSEDTTKNILNGLRDTIKGGAGTLFYRIP